jgi:formimidoylglutamate deiminase
MVPTPSPRDVLVREGDRTLLPALTTAHSHAFQRAMRGRAQRRAGAESAPGSFWSWRAAMYELSESLTPQSLHAIATVAFRELYEAGVRTVGEFHYVHHQKGGHPYADRVLLADVVIRAARATGLRIALLRAVYARAGAGLELEGPQRRFVDATPEHALADVDLLRARFAGDPGVRVGLAPHSVRAVPPAWLPALRDHAARHALPFHMHVAEQPREVTECVGETGRRPVELLAEAGLLSPRFVAVHATHLTPNEVRLLGEAGAGVCLCPTTERDLGDGLPNVSSLVEAGVWLSAGIDSHVLTDPLEDLREIELHERLRTLRRAVLGGGGGQSLAEWLWRVGSEGGDRALGFGEAAPCVELRRDHPSLSLVGDEVLLDAVVFGAPAAVLASV